MRDAEEMEAKAAQAETHCGPGFAKKIRERGERIIQRSAAQKLIDTKAAVANVALCNRGDLELACRALYGRTGLAGLREILSALDDWHTASIEVMTATGPDITPEEADALAT